MKKEMLEMMMWAHVNARLWPLTGWGGSAVRGRTMRRLELGATC